MLTQGDDVEVHALRKRGWSYVAIGRHIGRDWRTVKAYLEGRQPGVRRRGEPDPLARFVPYLRARFGDDPHVWASALFDEVVELGYPLSYPSFVRQVRAAGLRPRCEACHGVGGRDTIEIDHPAGDEIQWDWFERRRAPWGGPAYVLLGTLPHSGRTRGVLAELTDQAHLIEGMDGVLRRLGGTARHWRVDRMATVIVPGTGDVQASFSPVAKHYLLTELLDANTQVRRQRRDPPIRVDVVLNSRLDEQRARAFAGSGQSCRAAGRPACRYRGPMGALSTRRRGRVDGGGGVCLVC